MNFVYASSVAVTPVVRQKKNQILLPDRRALDRPCKQPTFSMNQTVRRKGRKNGKKNDAPFPAATEGTRLSREDIKQKTTGCL